MDAVFEFILLLSVVAIMLLVSILRAQPSQPGRAPRPIWNLKVWHHACRWQAVRDTGKTVYEHCACGQRRAWQRPGGYQPIDERWLQTGQWSFDRRERKSKYNIVWRFGAPPTSTA